MIVRTILQNLIPYCLRWFKKKRKEKKEEKASSKTPLETYMEDYKKIQDVLDKINWENIKDLEVGTKSNVFSVFPWFSIKRDDTKQNILIVDDYEDIIYVIDRAFKKLYTDYTNLACGCEEDDAGLNCVYKTHNVFQALGVTCSLTAMKFIRENKVDIAILDLTLGDLIHIDPETKLTMDGVDLIIEIIKRNPDCKFIFLTAHSFTKEDEVSLTSNIRQKYKNKFKLVLNKNIEDYVVSKQDIIDLPIRLKELIYVKEE